jgi:hypothetical protein
MRRRTIVTSALAILLSVSALGQRPVRPPAATRPSAQPSEKRLTAAHLLAIRNGGEVRLPPGIYVSAAQVNIRGMSGFTLAGEGVTIRGQLRLDDCKDFRISGIIFDGDRDSRGPQPNLPTLRLANCSNFTIEHCRFRDARGEHLYFESNCHDGLIANSHFIDAWRNAIAVINAHHLRFTANTIDTVHGEVLGAGIDIEGNAEDPVGCNHDITISGSTFRNCAESGVRITNGQEPLRIDVLDNTFENCTTGVLVGGRDCRVRGNFFRDAARPSKGEIGERARAAVYLNGTVLEGITEISGNRFERLSGLGAVNVHANWKGVVLIQGNVVFDVKGKGVNAFTIHSADVIVSGNYISRVENGIGIGISGRGATVTNNVLREGGGAGAIWSDVAGGFYAGNRVIDWASPSVLPKGNEVK